MFIFQILASLFILFAINRILARYREKRLPKSEVYVWLVFWLIIAGAVWWPQGTDIIARQFGISRGFELIVAASIAVIFYMLFKVFSHIHQLQQEMTELVRKLALKEEKEEGSDYGENT